MIIPHLDYAALVWASANDGTLSGLQDFQDKTLSKILKIKDPSPKTILKCTNLLPLDLRINEQLLIQTHNVIKSGYHSYFTLDFEPTIHDYNTRGSATTMRLPKPNTNFLKKTVSYRAIVVWNSIPDHVKNADCKAVLKTRYRKFASQRL